MSKPNKQPAAPNNPLPLGPNETPVTSVLLTSPYKGALNWTTGMCGTGWKCVGVAANLTAGYARVYLLEDETREVMLYAPYAQVVA